MHNCTYPAHHASCCPCCGYNYQTPAPHYYAVPSAEFCPGCHHPPHECCCPSAILIKYPQEIFADSFAGIGEAETYIGGENDVTVNLEYLSDGSDPLLVEVKVDSVVVLSITSAPAGYYVKKLPLQLPPGSVISLTVKKCRARLRWCEDLIC
ncbi:MAG: hypothetical protein OEV42_03855 [Deltaproteobacteria bacterium]|nr:hypothetical protein [Deltaproteobacteria bacterium]